MPLVYTSNDEVDSPQILAVEVSTGKVAGTADLSPGLPGDGDPESLRLDVKNGILYLADIGDGDEEDPDDPPSRTNCALYGLPEFGPGAHGTLPCKKYPISYPGGVKHNSEALAINPVSGLTYIITKGVQRSILYRMNRPFSTVSNVLQGITSALPPLVTDADFTINGQWLLLRVKGKNLVYVLDHHTWKTVGTIAVPATVKGESITCEPGGKSFLIGSEGTNSPIYRVILPTKYRGNSTPTPDSPPTSPTQPVATKPSQIINFKFWKLTLPTGKQGDPDEKQGPSLVAGYEHPKYFYDSNGRVVFTTPHGGVTTGGSVNPRTELREMWDNGSYGQSHWSSTRGNHRMTMTRVSVNHVGAVEKQVTFMQLHDADDDRVMVLYEGTSSTAGNLWAEWGNGKGQGGTRDLIMPYTLGQVIPKIALNINASGFRVLVNDVSQAFTARTASGCYFKAGCYPQKSGAESDNDFAQVRIGGLVVNHT
jgi:hypothetical protein